MVLTGESGVGEGMGFESLECRFFHSRWDLQDKWIRSSRWLTGDEVVMREARSGHGNVSRYQTNPELGVCR